jgi:hypothetical protein
MSNSTSEFCFENMSGAITIDSWYTAQLFFLFAFFAVSIALIVLIELNYLHSKFLDLFNEGTVIFSLAFVLMALARNLHIFLTRSSIPLCGVEQFPFCTGLTSDITGIFFHIYAGANFSFAIVATIVTELGKWKATEMINYREMPFAFSLAYLLSVGKKTAIFMIEKIAALVMAIFSPGMVLLEVMPFNDYCIQDQNLNIILIHAVTHGSIFIACCIAPVLDLMSGERTFQWTALACAVFTFSGIVMFFIQFFASVSQPAVVSLFSFSVVYPTLVAVGEKLAMITDTLCVAFFAAHTGSNFLKPRPRWALNHRISLFEERYSSVTFTEALGNLRGALDRFYAALDVEELEAHVRNEASERGNLFPQNAAADEVEGRLAVLALTTILAPREGRWKDKLIRRVQLFDRLHDTLEAAMLTDLHQFERELEPRIMPLLVLIARGIRLLPTSSTDDSWVGGADPTTSYFLLRRFSHQPMNEHWFEDHVGPPTDDEFSPRGSDIFPVLFRSFVWGYSDSAPVTERAGKNDAVITVRSSSAISFQYSYIARAPMEGVGVCNPSYVPLGQTRFLGQSASASWYNSKRGDVLYCPGAKYAVEHCAQGTAPLHITISDIVDVGNDAGVSDTHLLSDE